MTPEDQQEVMAETLGFEVLSRTKGGSKFVGRKKGYRDGDWCVLPNWANDLNAMREAVCSLRPEEANKWVQELIRIVEFGANPHWLPDYHIANAIAAHRLEAFLKMKGLWKDEA